MKALYQTNHGSACDFRPAGKKDPVAPCPIPEWIRTIAKAEGGYRMDALNLEGNLARALMIASLENASFSMSREEDQKIKETIRLYIVTWLIPPLVKAMAQARANGVKVLKSVSGVDMITAERQRQVSQEGWSSDHDDGHTNGELRDAAIAYVMVCDDRAGENAKQIWPWDTYWKPDEDQVRNLVKAGALIAAEIDRLLRREGKEVAA